jgi:hypothetical protein
MLKQLAAALVTAAFCNITALAQEPAPIKERPAKVEIREKAVKTEAKDKEKAKPEKASKERMIQEDHGRLRRFLEEHPEVAERMKAKADANGDGMLDEEEKAAAREWVRQVHEEHMRERHERWLEFKSKHPEAAARIEAKADRNGDGTVDRHERWDTIRELRDERWLEFERNHPKAAKELKERADTNDDGKVGPRERHEARKEVRENVRERRAERREERKDAREERRDERKDVREERREGREERREDRRDARQDRREVRQERRTK